MSVWYDEKRKHWIYKFWQDRETYRQGGFKTKSAAAKAEREKRNELDRPIETATASLVDLSNLYLDHCAATHQPNTVRYKTQYFRVFIKAVMADGRPVDEEDRDLKHKKIPQVVIHPPIFIETPAEQISKHVFEKFLDAVATQQGRKLSNRYLKNLKALYNWGIRNDYLTANPLKHIEPKGEDQPRKYVPPPEDINAVLLAAGQEEMDMILTIYSTGARISEILRLTWEDVNIEQNSITLWTRKRKGGGMQSDTLAMTEKLNEVMRRRWKARNKESQFVFCKPDGSRYTRDDHFIKQFMPLLCRKAKVKAFGFHAIRHRVAAILMDSGKATLGDIQHFLRQRRATTTEIYLRSLKPGSQEMAGILDALTGDGKQDKNTGKM